MSHSYSLSWTDGLTARTNYHPTEQIVRGSSRATPFHTRSAGSVSQGSNRGSPTDYVSTDGGMVQDLIAGSESNSSKSPLASFGFLKNLTGDKKTTKDGQTPKRRGPKPDSKPALTRRQELNRQAQRQVLP
ncbi:hypothetical protein M501DRAFT_1018887 [Patellaria atrata CBS 101060]|uniref:Uncharacterized protein n=1 Tax=Patellaria atrata CBS 101060 TaxID=1346257 RepID=A0A9P4S7D5_9PEZI|nr:hypothetical protein M501DRAFT_1018887 [Patellaria atrata CBS 101060]